jgi:hypothetical protein
MSPRLSAVQQNNIAVWCSCGHSDSVAVGPIFARLGDITVKEAVSRMRCTRCGARSAILHVRIHYVGASAVALAAGHGQCPAPDDAADDSAGS